MSALGDDIRRLRWSVRPKSGSPWHTTSQEEFAGRFGISVGALRDVEQGRTAPTRAMRVLMAAIELDSDLIEIAALLAMDRWRRETTDNQA